MILRVVAFVLIGLTSSAKGEFVPGNVFLETCQSPNPERQAACTGFIAGVTDSYLHSHQFCISPNVQAREISDFVKSYLRTPSIRGQPASGMVLLALKARWPCSGLQQGPAMTFQFRGF